MTASRLLLTYEEFEEALREPVVVVPPETDDAEEADAEDGKEEDEEEYNTVLLLALEDAWRERVPGYRSGATSTPNGVIVNIEVPIADHCPSLMRTGTACYPDERDVDDPFMEAYSVAFQRASAAFGLSVLLEEEGEGDVEEPDQQC